jgi:RNA polymerase sigma factor (sigma-70 family)
MVWVEDRAGESVIAGARSGPDALVRTRESLASALSWLETSSALVLSSRKVSGLSCSREDLVQFVAVAALTKVERRHRESGTVPEWCQPEERMRAYLRGMLARTVLRMLRDARARREVALPMERLVREGRPSRLERLEERDHARACLEAFTVDDLRLFLQFGDGHSYAELAGRIGSSPAALAKRRARALDRLRERCRGCSWRIDNGCSWLPRGWGAHSLAPRST